jgi:hypothetical protein
VEKILNILILHSQAGRRVDTLNIDLLLKLEFPSNPELLCVARGAMERLTERMGFPNVSAGRSPGRWTKL